VHHSRSRFDTASSPRGTIAELCARNDLTFHGYAMYKANEQDGVEGIAWRLIYAANQSRIKQIRRFSYFP